MKPEKKAKRKEITEWYKKDLWTLKALHSKSNHFQGKGKLQKWQKCFLKFCFKSDEDMPKSACYISKLKKKKKKNEKTKNPSCVIDKIPIAFLCSQCTDFINSHLNHSDINLKA